jgi:hypothetical protein
MVADHTGGGNGTPLELVLSRLSDAAPNGDGWRARCPAHDDNSPSLSVNVTAEGHVLVHCFTGCDARTIVEKMGLTMSDLFVGNGSRNGTGAGGSASGNNGEKKAREAKKKPRRSFADRTEVLSYLDRLLKKDSYTRVRTYHYMDAAGDIVAAVARYEQPAIAGTKPEKTFRPVHREGAKWFLGDPPGPWPLYRLGDLAEAKRVFVCEGEKAADAVRGLGLAGTTSAHGSQSPGKTDWSPLGGKEVVLLPDNDEPGKKYAAEVARILLGLGCKVRAVDLAFANRSEGDDAFDWIASRKEHGAKKASLASELGRLASEAEVIEGVTDLEKVFGPTKATAKARKGTYRPIPPFKHFPIGDLPGPLAAFVTQASLGLNCDPAMIALPVLAAAAAAIGNARAVRLKKRWQEPCGLWSALVLDSGLLKSPCIDVATAPLSERQAAELEAYRNALEAHELALEEWRGTRGPGRGPRPVPPEKAARFLVDDVTIEALAERLSHSPKGVLVSCDELEGWFNSFVRYKQRGSDRDRWQRLHTARTLIVDRKTGPPLAVRRALVSVTGATQTATMRRLANDEVTEGGLLARLLLSSPPPRKRVWTEDDLRDEDAGAYANLLLALHALPLADVDERKPFVIELTPEAREVWIGFYDEWGEVQWSEDGAQRAASAKLEGYAPRLALIHGVVEAVAAGHTEPEPIAAASMAAAVKLVRWFAYETARVYAMLGESRMDAGVRLLVDWVGRHGGQVTVRDLQRSNPQRWPNRDEAEAALQELVEMGIARWVDTPAPAHGGWPTRLLVLLGNYEESPDTRSEYTQHDTESGVTSKTGTRHSSDTRRHSTEEGARNIHTVQEVTSNSPPQGSPDTRSASSAWSEQHNTHTEQGVTSNSDLRGVSSGQAASPDTRPEASSEDGEYEEVIL